MRTITATVAAEKPRIGEQIPAYVLDLPVLPIGSAEGRQGILQTWRSRSVGETIEVRHCVAKDSYGVEENGAYFEMYEPSK